MPAKKKPEPPAENEFALDAALDPLQSFFDAYPNANRKFKIGRYVGNAVEHLASTSELPDEDALQETYGGGRFVIRAFADGVQRGQIEIRIAHKPGYVPPADVTGDDVNKSATNVPMNDDSFIKQLLLKMVGMGGQVTQQATPVNELAEAMKTIHAMNGGTANPGKEYAEGLKAGIELARSVGGGGELDWKTEAFRMLKDVIPSVASGVVAMTGKQAAPQRVAAVPQSAAPIATLPPEDELNKIIFGGIQELKKYCMKNTPPELIVDWVVNNAEQYHHFVRAALNRSYDSFATIDPEIASEPYNTFFRSFYDGLRSAFDPTNNVDDDNDGRDGDTGNAAHNANTGPQRIAK